MTNYDNYTKSLTDEIKSNNAKYNLSKFEYDLYHEEDDVVELPTVEIKRVSLPNNGEKWKIFKNSQVFIEVEGTKLTKKERSYLHSVEGISFILNNVKNNNITSFNKFKVLLKKQLDNLNKKETAVKKTKISLNKKTSKKRGRKKKNK